MKTHRGFNIFSSSGFLRVLPAAILFLFLSVHPCYSAEHKTKNGSTTITADTIETIGESNTYVAIGSVVIKHDDAVINSDFAVYDEEESEAYAWGNLKYHSPDIAARGSSAELQIAAETGVFHDAEIFFKKEYNYVSGKTIEKRGDRYYYSPEATFTTCDPPAPAWCIRGREAEALIGGMLTSRGTTLRFRDIPVLYTPYFWGPLLTERQTGFLIPSIGYSSRRGGELSIPFFWAISENRDATITLDGYTRSGLGLGAEYRFLELNGFKGDWSAFHINDAETGNGYWELKALTENHAYEKASGYLSINYVNEDDFYDQFAVDHQTRVKRYTESIGEINMPLTDARAYILAQYRQDLQYDTDTTPQKLPEVGFVKNYSRMWGLIFGGEADMVNFESPDGYSGVRADFFPQFIYSFGRDFVVTQRAAARETLYSFSDYAGAESHAQRSALEYDIMGHMRFSRDFDTFKHMMEPSIRYHYITYNSLDVSLPSIDSTETYAKTSSIELSVLNRGILNGAEFMTFTFTQPIETLNGDRPLQPFYMQANLERPVSLVLDAYYEWYERRFEAASATLNYTSPQLPYTVALGQRYNRAADTMTLNGELRYNFSKELQGVGSVWYEKKEGFKHIGLTLHYFQQCWTLKLETVKTQNDFKVRLLVDLLGLTSKMPKTAQPRLHGDPDFR